MIITFCGHSDFKESNNELKDNILSAIKEASGNRYVTFYLGGYGGFDSYALEICKEYKKDHPASSIVFITPYTDDSYLKDKNPLTLGYDEIVYADIENAPKKYAIIARNKWMITQSDVLIAYVDYSVGGAAKTLDFAKKQPDIKIINFGHLEK